MQLVLNREYWPGGTNGTLTLESKILGVTVEPKATHFGSGRACIPEGVYTLRLELDGGNQKILLTKTGSNSRKFGQPEPELGVEQLHRNIVLVSEITGEGRGVPSREAFQNLVSQIGQTLGKGEKATLEIRSCPECALNLTYHQIQWMD